MPNINDFHRGDTKTYKFLFQKNTGTVAVPVLVAIDITGYVLWMTMKLVDSDADGSAALQVNTTAGADILDDPVNGIMHITLTSTDTGVLVPNTKYFYDFQRVIPGGTPDVSTIQAGKVKVLRDITQTIL